MTPPGPAPGRAERSRFRRGWAASPLWTTPNTGAPAASDTTMSVKENPPRSNAHSATSTQAGLLLSENLKFWPQITAITTMTLWVRRANTL